MVFLMLLFLMFPLTSRGQTDEGAELAVEVVAMKHLEGEIGIALFNGKKGFPTKMERSYEAAWIPLQKVKKVAHVFEGLPPGDYAVSVFHDENGDRLLDRTILGYPLEGVGFSNECRVQLLAPPFRKCNFPLSAQENKRLVIKLEYRNSLLGGD